MKTIAVITGASSGMGREFVYAIDKDMELDELWVIARREDRLLELQPQVRAKIRPVVLDLLDRNSLSQFKALLDIEKPDVRVLVNAAGFGLFGTYTEMDMEKQLEIIDLNDRALTEMTYITLPYMPNGAQIYNMGSMSSFQPVPYINVYGASKTSVYKGYKQDKIEMRGDRAEMSDFPLYLNTVAGGLDRRDQTIGGFSFVVKIYAVPVVEIIG